MSDNSCSYNCSERPESVSPYPDISGIGVVTGYFVTAVLVVGLVTGFFFTSFDPMRDPFGNWEDAVGDTSRYKPNPVDVIVLDLIKNRKILYPAKQGPMHHHIIQMLSPDCGFLGLYSPVGMGTRKAQPTTRITKLYTKGIQSMSDIQIFTGLSILISAFANLRCGISCYHWQVMVYLAWFSALTHLSCLTVLRNQLYNSKGERTWRILGMGVVLVMLLVAMIPTGNYDWFSDLSQEPTPAPRDYAQCYFELSRRDGVDSMTFGSMVISTLLLAFGFLIRITKTYRVISVDIVKRLRDIVSNWVRNRVLLRLYNKLKLGEEERPTSSSRLLGYRLILAAFLVCRFGFDVWASMTIEVWWLIVAFIWGSINLFKTRALSDGGNSDWTIGQIIPVILLAAPLTTMIKYLYGSKDIPTAAAHTTPPTTPNHDSSPPVTAAMMQLEEEQPTLSGDHPDYDHYKYSKWVNEIVVFYLVDVVVTTVLCIASFGAYNLQIVYLVVPTSDILAWLPVTQFIMLETLILFYLLAPSPQPELSADSRPEYSWHQAYHRFLFRLRLVLPWILLTIVPVGLFTFSLSFHVLLLICPGSYFLLSGFICISQKRVSQVVAA